MCRSWKSIWPMPWRVKSDITVLGLQISCLFQWIDILNLNELPLIGAVFEESTGGNGNTNLEGVVKSFRETLDEAESGKTLQQARGFVFLLVTISMFSSQRSAPRLQPRASRRD